jgi:hypothetical protein
MEHVAGNATEIFIGNYSRKTLEAGTVDFRVLDDAVSCPYYTAPSNLTDSG